MGRRWAQHGALALIGIARAALAGRAGAGIARAASLRDFGSVRCLNFAGEPCMGTYTPTSLRMPNGAAPAGMNIY